MRFLKIIWFILGISLVWSFSAVEAKQVMATLPWPDEGSTQETLEASITGIARKDDRFILSSLRNPFLIAGPFRGLMPSRKETFGEFLESERKIWPKSVPSGSWRSLVVVGSHVLAVDGDGLNIVAFSATTQELTSQHSLAWDIIKPPRDRGVWGAHPDVWGGERRACSRVGG